MKTNKSRRIKRQSRFRNTRNKRKSVKRQRGGDPNDEKFNKMTQQTWKPVYFSYNKIRYTGEILGNTTSSLLVIGNLKHDVTYDNDYKYLISLFGYFGVDKIELKKPSAYWSSEKKDAATEIIETLHLILSSRGTPPMYDDSE